MHRRKLRVQRVVFIDRPSRAFELSLSVIDPNLVSNLLDYFSTLLLHSPLLFLARLVRRTHATLVVFF